MYYLRRWLGRLKPAEKTQRCLLLAVMTELVIYQIIFLESQTKS